MFSRLLKFSSLFGLDIVPDMEYLKDDEILTNELQQKIDKLTQLKEATNEVNDSIALLKADIHSIQSQRAAANAALNVEIQRQTEILSKRQKYKQRLERELTKLKVMHLKTKNSLSFC